MKVFRNRPNKIDDSLIEDFKDEETGEEYRYAYAEQHLNTWIALQIKALREQRGMKQSELVALIGTKQPGVARYENVNYSKWNTETLKKVARALGVRLKITFETFGSLLDEDADFDRHTLERPEFDDDPVFHVNEETERAVVNDVPPSLGNFKSPPPAPDPVKEDPHATQEDEVADLPSVVKFEEREKKRGLARR